MPKLATFFTSLYGRLTLLILFVVSMLGGFLICTSKNVTEASRLQVMQGVNRSTAMYVAGQEPLITDQGVQQETVTTLARRAMIINPSLEIYVLDNDGKILEHRLPDGSVKLSSVDLDPVKAFIAGNQPLPIIGDDPRRPDSEAVFSVSPIEFNGTQYGYVYAIVGGEVFQALQQEATDATTLTLFGWLGAFAIIAAAFVGSVFAFVITRPVACLSNQMGAYQPGDVSPECHESKGSNEISVLQRRFSEMKRTIAEQLDAIQTMDKTRRELIANVSHDLRTPLAAMQGSLEVMIIQGDEISAADRELHVKTAFKQSRRLTRLVGDLFELAKLESGGIAPKLERFSVMELLQDCSFDLAPIAERKGVSLQLAVGSTANAVVLADISLIQRVLENLIQNAIGHTPQGGEVTLSVEVTDGGARVAVADTGKGIDSAELPHIFERFYQAKNTEHSSQIGSGLGLAIVKRILSIHDASINVSSRLNVGTRFEFELQTA